MSQDRVKVGELWESPTGMQVYITNVEDCSDGVRIKFVYANGSEDSYTNYSTELYHFFVKKLFMPYSPPKTIWKNGGYYLRYSDGVDVIIPRFRFGEQKEDALSTKPKYFNDAVCDDSYDCDDEDDDDDDDDEFGCGIEDLDDCCEYGVEGYVANLNIAAQNVTIHVSNYYDGSVAKSE